MPTNNVLLPKKNTYSTATCISLCRFLGVPYVNGDSLGEILNDLELTIYKPFI